MSKSRRDKGRAFAKARKRSGGAGEMIEKHTKRVSHRKKLTEREFERKEQKRLGQLSRLQEQHLVDADRSIGEEDGA